MVAVAAIALVLGGVQAWRSHRLAQALPRASRPLRGSGSLLDRRRRRARESADDWQKGEDEFRRKTDSPLPSPSVGRIAIALLTAEKCSRIANYYSGLKNKYGRAANYPWLPVQDDPPLGEPRP